MESDDTNIYSKRFLKHREKMSRLLSLPHEIKENRNAENSTYKLIQYILLFNEANKLNLFEGFTAKEISRKLNLSASYLYKIYSLRKNLAKSHLDYILANYKSINTDLLYKISYDGKKDPRTITNKLKRMVEGVPQRKKYGSLKKIESVKSKDNWSSHESTLGLETYAKGLFEATRCRTKVQKLDNGTIEVKFKCLTEGDLENLFEKILF